MKTKIQLLTLLMSLFILVACDAIGKHYLKDLDFRRDHGNEYAYNKDGSVFTGTAWSSDGKTVKIEVNNGVINYVTLYHSNGDIAAQYTAGSRIEKYYDTNGNQISEQQFKKEYPEVMVQLGAFEHEVHYLEK